MRQYKLLQSILLIALLLLAGCDGDGEGPTPVPTATLAPLVNLTPRVTATPYITRTPRPTFTPIPSDTPIPPTPTNTLTPTATPPVTGIIGGMRTINVREGPGVAYDVIGALVPGTQVEIVYQNPEGTWFNIRMEDGMMGWVWAQPVYIESTATPFPTTTPSPDLTSLALGTPLPTALLGGGTVTPTPPRSAVTATPPGTPAEETGSPTQPFLPTINVDAINMTATALAGGGSMPISPPAPRTLTPPVGATTAVAASPVATGPLNATPTIVPLSSPGASATAFPTALGQPIVQEGADVFAMCNDPTFRIPAPTNLAAGSTIEVYWAWFVTDPEYMQQHMNAVSYEVRINDTLLANWRQYGSPTVQEGDWYVKYWYVPIGPLEAGTYRIAYRATWSETITDGVAYFGPNTNNPVEEGSCDFVVR